MSSEAGAVDTAERAKQEREELERAPPESAESLWWLAVPAALWTAHFLAVYVTVAVWCAKVGGEAGPLGPTRVAVLVYTIVALLLLGATFLRGLKKHRLHSETVPHDFDTPGDRSRFLGFASLLLSGLAFVGVIFVALPALFIETCR